MAPQGGVEVHTLSPGSVQALRIRDAASHGGGTVRALRVDGEQCAAGSLFSGKGKAGRQLLTGAASTGDNRTVRNFCGGLAGGEQNAGGLDGISGVLDFPAMEASTVPTSAASPSRKEERITAGKPSLWADSLAYRQESGREFKRK